MKRFFYDFHLHSCLSPCADNDNTPNNLCGMGMLAGLGLLALTDHNSCANCPAFFEAAARVGIVPVAGMELTTAEEVHLVCLFETLRDAMAFDADVRTRRLTVENRPSLFGDQLITDGDDNVTGTEPYVLAYATGLSIDEGAALARLHGGVCYPAHIDRPSNGILSVLGDLPPEPGFRLAEVYDLAGAPALRARYPALGAVTLLTGSDAHALETIRDAACAVDLDCADDDASVRRALFAKLREGTL